MVMMLCVVIGCGDGTPPTKPRAALRPHPRIARDRDNGLELVLEFRAGDLNQGQACMFGTTVTNVSAGRCIVLPEFPLHPGFLSEEGLTIVSQGRQPPFPSWRDFFLGPFCFRGSHSYAPGFLLFDSYPSAPPRKESQRKSVEETCKEIELVPDWLKTVALAPGETWQFDVTVTIPRHTKYIDMGLYFDLEKLGRKGPLPISLKKRDPRMRPSAPRRLSDKPIRDDEIPIWEGFLYVFLELPDLPKPKEQEINFIYIDEPDDAKE